VDKRVLTPRFVLVLFLTVAICYATIQAKRGVYYPERSDPGIISKIIKLAEFRIERVPAEPLSFAVIVPLLITFEEQPLPVDEEKPNVTLPSYSCSHWFRPPPSFV